MTHFANCKNWMCLTTLILFLTLGAMAHAADWTFMVYLDADNNLEPDGIDDFLEMASVGSTDDVNILVLFDRVPGYSTEYGDWKSTRRGRIERNDTPVSEWGEFVGELNMADPNTLKDFATWGIQNYPANNYALIMWNHGGGWRSRDGISKGPLSDICWDETSNNACMYNYQMRQALEQVASNTGASLDVIGFDACLMAMCEVAYEMRNLADVMVASEESEPGAGWPYNTILADLTANPSMNSAELGTVIVDRYYASYSNNYTQSAIDLNQMDNLAAVVGQFVSTMLSNWATDYDACLAQALNVRAAIDAAVIHEQSGAIMYPGAYGLAIYLPHTHDTYSEIYDSNTRWSGATGWGNFVKYYMDNMAGSWIEDARNQTMYFSSRENLDLYDFCVELWNNRPPNILVTPESTFQAKAAHGGPFSMTNLVYTIENVSDETIAWTASTVASWLDIDRESGSLTPGQSTQVRVSLNAYAYRFPGGSFSADVVFTDLNISQEQKRKAVLAIEKTPYGAFFWEPLNHDPGWTRDSGWAFGVPQGFEGDPDSGFVGQNVYGYNLNGAYENAMAEKALRTRAINCSGRDNVHLRFMRWIGVENNTYDEASVQVSTNGSNWTTVWENPDYVLQDTEWTEVVFDISSIADNQSTVYVKWVMGATDLSVTYSGWNIDDIALMEGAGSPGAAQFGDTQYVDVNCTGNVTASVWDFSDEQWVASSRFRGNGALAYTAPRNTWIVQCLYDEDAGQWVQGTYLYNQGWRGKNPGTATASKTQGPIVPTIAATHNRPQSSPIFSETQSLVGHAPGNFSIQCFDYNLGNWTAQIEAYRFEILAYPSPAGHWMVNCLYDLDSGQWAEGAYVYPQSW